MDRAVDKSADHHGMEQLLLDDRTEKIVVLLD